MITEASTLRFRRSKQNEQIYTHKLGSNHSQRYYAPCVHGHDARTSTSGATKTNFWSMDNSFNFNFTLPSLPGAHELQLHHHVCYHLGRSTPPIKTVTWNLLRTSTPGATKTNFWAIVNSFNSNFTYQDRHLKPTTDNSPWNPSRAYLNLHIRSP